jgi:hypothetical protein
MYQINKQAGKLACLFGSSDISLTYKGGISKLPEDYFKNSALCEVKLALQKATRYTHIPFITV